MQRPVRGYRGGSHLTHTHRIKDDNDGLSLSNSSSEDNENNSTIKSKDSSMLTTSADIESAIRSFRALTTSKKKAKTNPNISSQKADLPQLNMITDKTNNLNGQSHHWFPKPDIGNVDSNDFIRHNHVGKSIKYFSRKKKTQNLILNHLLDSQQPTPPALLTTIPPVGISTRPTAIIAPVGPTRSISEFFSSNSSIKKLNNNSIYDFQTNSLLKLTASSLIQTASSAFQPINSIQNLSSNSNKRLPIIKIKSESFSMDIPKHKPLIPGQKLPNVHISHPQSPSIIHVNNFLFLLLNKIVLFS
jgi:hypothetical protein